MNNRNSNYRWYVVAMLWCISFFNYADRQAIYSVFPLLEKELGLSMVQLGMLGSAFAWVYGKFTEAKAWLQATEAWRAIRALSRTARDYVRQARARLVGGFSKLAIFRNSAR